MSHADDDADLLSDLGASQPGLASEVLAHRLVAACVAALPITGAAIVWMTDSGPGKTLAASDEPVMVLEELQFSLGEGPCIESSETGRSVLRPDLKERGAESWPACTRGALDAGVRAVFALPLHIGPIRIGVLDLYRSQPGALDSAALLTALAYADAATEIPLQLQADAGALEMLDASTWVRAAHSTVHQATGMVAVQLSVDVATALVSLRARAFALERSIDDVANDVIARRIRFT